MHLRTANGPVQLGQTQTSRMASFILFPFADLTLYVCAKSIQALSNPLLIFQLLIDRGDYLIPSHPGVPVLSLPCNSSAPRLQGSIESELGKEVTDGVDKPINLPRGRVTGPW